MTELPKNAATFRYAIRTDDDVAMKLAALAAKQKERERAATLANERSRHAAIHGDRATPRSLEWYEGLTEAQARQKIGDLFDAGRWDCLLAMHYEMTRLARGQKSACEKIIEFPEPSDLEQIRASIGRLTTQLELHAPETGDELLVRQIASLKKALSTFCPVDEPPPTPLKGGLS